MASEIEDLPARDALIAELAKSDGDVDEQLKKVNEFGKAVRKEERKGFGIKFKMLVVSAVLLTFVFGNLASWYMIYRFAYAEFNLIEKNIVLSNRLITEKVILATIAGTIIQISAAFGFIVRYLFPPEKKVTNNAPTASDDPQ